MATKSTKFEKGQVLRGKAHVYHLLGLLGAGGMGSTHKFWDHGIGPIKNFALKIMDPQFAKNDPGARQHFLDEGRLTIIFEHPNVVGGRWVDELHDGTPVYAMDLLNGETVRALIRRRGRVDVYEALNIIIDVLRGLHHAHKHGVTHQDVKPSNVVLHKPYDAPSLAKVIDFGVPRLIDDQDKRFAGTFAYAAKEQFTSGNVGPWTDIFGVAGLLFELLTGKRPFADAGNTLHGAIARMDRRPPRLSELGPFPSELADLLDRAFSPDPAERPQSAARFAEALVRVARELEPAPKRVYTSEVGRPIRREDLASPTDPAVMDYEELHARIRAATPEPETVGGSITAPAAAPPIGAAASPQPTAIVRAEASPVAIGSMDTERQPLRINMTEPMPRAAIGGAAVKVERVPISQLVTDPRAARVHSDVQPKIPPTYVDSEKRPVPAVRAQARAAFTPIATREASPPAPTTSRVADRADVVSVSAVSAVTPRHVAPAKTPPSPRVAEQPAKRGLDADEHAPRRYSPLEIRLRRAYQSRSVHRALRMIRVSILLSPIMFVVGIILLRLITGSWVWDHHSNRRPASAASVQPGPRP